MQFSSTDIHRLESKLAESKEREGLLHMALHRTGICPLIERGQCVDFSDSRDKHDDARIERRRVDASLSDTKALLAEAVEALDHCAEILEYVVLHGNADTYGGGTVQGVASAARAFLAKVPR
jgi:hypothetical protein